MAKYIGQGRGFQQRPRTDGHDDGKEEKVDSETQTGKHGSRAKNILEQISRIIWEHPRAGDGSHVIQPGLAKNLW